jgi:hypothetical protein
MKTFTILFISLFLISCSKDNPVTNHQTQNPDIYKVKLISPANDDTLDSYNYYQNFSWHIVDSLNYYAIYFDSSSDFHNPTEYNGGLYYLDSCYENITTSFIYNHISRPSHSSYWKVYASNYPYLNKTDSSEIRKFYIF